MISVLGYSWGNFRVAGIINGISPAHAEFLNDGGLGLTVGDGMLPHPGNERIIRDVLQLRLSWRATLPYAFHPNPA
jgi:high affinity Mn2+ porin